MTPPNCPKCGDNRQVWANQITGRMTCHRIDCHTEIETMIKETEAMKLALEALKKVHYEAINSGINNNALLVKEIAKAHAALAALAQPERPAQQPLSDEWTPCVKKPVVVHVRAQRTGEMHVSTREGLTPVKPDDLIMRGVQGEEYPIGRAIFEQTYTIGDELAQPAQQPKAWNKRIRDNVDKLLAEMGFDPESSARNQLACMNFDEQPAQQPVNTETT